MEGICPICKTESRLIKHHTKYYPEETILVCESCHSKIHKKPNFYDNLCPEWYVDGETFRKKKCERKTIRKRDMDKIKKGGRERIKLPIKKIIEAYKDGCGINFLAKQFDVSNSVIINRLKEERKYQKGKFSSITSEIQYKGKL